MQSHLPCSDDSGSSSSEDEGAAPPLSLDSTLMMALTPLAAPRSAARRPIGTAQVRPLDAWMTSSSMSCTVTPVAIGREEKANVVAATGAAAVRASADPRRRPRHRLVARSRSRSSSRTAAPDGSLSPPFESSGADTAASSRDTATPSPLYLRHAAAPVTPVSVPRVAASPIPPLHIGWTPSPSASPPVRPHAAASLAHADFHPSTGAPLPLAVNALAAASTTPINSPPARLSRHADKAHGPREWQQGEQQQQQQQRRWQAQSDPSLLERSAAVPASLSSPHPPGEHGVMSLLRRLPDAEFRRVMMHWLETQMTASGFAGGAAAIAANVSVPASFVSPSALCTGLLASYSSLHRWASTPPPLLRRIFSFLSLPELVRLVRPSCGAWRAALDAPHADDDDVDDTDADAEQVWGAHHELLLPFSGRAGAPSLLSNTPLLSLLSSLPLVQGVRLAPAAFASSARASGFACAAGNSAASQWCLGTVLPRLVALLPRLRSLRFEGCSGLREGDLCALLPSSVAQPALALVGSPAEQLLHPHSCALRRLSLRRCVPVSLALLTILSALPALAHLDLYGTAGLTASRDCGLQLFSASAAAAPVAATAAASSGLVLSPTCFPALTSLSLGPLSSDAALIHLLPCARLRRLSLQGRISDTGIASLAVMSGLTSLSLAVTVPDDDGDDGDTIATAAWMDEGRGAHARGGRTGSDAVSSQCSGRGLAALESLSHLSELRVSIPTLGLEGVQGLCAITALRNLVLSTRGALPDSDGDEGGGPAPTRASRPPYPPPLASSPTFLSLLSFLPRLEQVDLSGLSFLDDSALSYLPHASLCARLRVLRLRGLANLTDTSAYWLAKLRALQLLDVRGTGMRVDAGIRELRAAPRLRNCAIRWGEQPAVSVPAAAPPTGAGATWEDARSVQSATRPAPTTPLISFAPGTPIIEKQQQQAQQPPHPHPLVSSSASSSASDASSVPVPAPSSSPAATALLVRQQMSRAEHILARLHAAMHDKPHLAHCRAASVDLWPDDSPAATATSSHLRDPAGAHAHAHARAHARSRSGPMSPSELSSSVAARLLASHAAAAAAAAVARAKGDGAAGAHIASVMTPLQPPPPPPPQQPVASASLHPLSAPPPPTPFGAWEKEEAINDAPVSLHRTRRARARAARK